MSEKVYNVVFDRRWDAYQKGERAGFAKPLADHLIQKGVARPYEGLPVARKGENIPESAMTPEELKHVRDSKRVLEQQEIAKQHAREEAMLAKHDKGDHPFGGGKRK
ncbi:MAG: hypothetical protein AMJ46_12600 [Latescibacteria bacterium DG_63]|nr:MAG: hypothetical protein AMJ46_12600 [Latescibacteria bacterium DG_63]